MASRCASGVAEPSGPVMALPPRAITTRRAVTCATLAAPEVEPVPAGAEAGRLDDVHGEVEPVADPRGLVGVAAEADRVAALLAEPPHLVHRGEGAAGVHLERPAAEGQGAEHRPVLLPVVLLHV